MVSHPSQLQHPCLTEDPEYFYLSHFDPVNKRLWKTTLILAISSVLASRAVYVSDWRIHGLVEAFLYDLKFATRIQEKIKTVLDTLVGSNSVKHGMLKQALEIWEDGLPEDEDDILIVHL